jgi:ribosomal protein S12 methylthiotransferase
MHALQKKIGDRSFSKSMPTKSGLRVSVNYHGCEKRKLDAQRILNYFTANGYKSTPEVRNADIVVFVTCAFNQSHQDISLEKLQKLYSQLQRNTQMVVSGCLPAINPPSMASFPGIIAIGPRELDKFDGLINATVPFESIEDPNETVFEGKHSRPRPIRVKISPEDNFEGACEIEVKETARWAYERARSSFKIRLNEGCLGNCAYCVTRYATGALQSKPLSVVLQEFKAGRSKGESSFFFTGGDSGAYGVDLGISIIDFLEEIFKDPGDFQIHFHDFGIQWLIKHQERLIPLLAANNSRLGCFSFPIQSGSDRVLSAMRRPYQAKPVIDTLNKLKKEAPNILIGTHFIVGFPGETEADFNQTIEMLQEAAIDFVMIYRYTDHERADSYNFSNKIDEKTVENRFERLSKFYYLKIAKS